MIKNALFCLSLFCGSIYGAVEYDIVLLAPKGEELTTESYGWGDLVKINDAGYVIGIYQFKDNVNCMSYVYHQKLGFKTISFPDNKTLHSYSIEGIEGIRSINNQGIAVGIYGGNDLYRHYKYHDNNPKVFIFDAKTDECYDLLDSFGLTEAEGFSLKNSYVNKVQISDDNRVFLNCDSSNYVPYTYIYDLNQKTVSFFADGGLIAVNQKGQMIGGNEDTKAWFHDPRFGMQTLGSLDQFNRWQVNPQAISPNGIVAGFGKDSYGEQMCFLWSLDLGLLPLDIGVNYPDVVGVTDKGQVLGEFEMDCEDDYSIHPFLYSLEAGFLDLGTLGGYESRAKAINNKAKIVGFSTTSRYEGDRAFIWEPGHGMRDLTTLIPKKSGWKVLENAESINDAGCIIGWGKYFGVSHHCLLIPKNPTK